MCYFYLSLRKDLQTISPLDRKKVLKHHPDKKAGVAGDSNDDAFFKCIQKAMEVLSHSEKRRQFDSVDPHYEELEQDVPTEKQVKSAKDPNAFFFKSFGPIFEREARFSRKQPVPMLGEFNDTKQQVEGFYDFWYNFDSWRSFEYMDKEVNEGSDSRDDKRYTEKKNKAERARRKKEDIARVRQLVDLALSVDPRIKRIKQEEKEAREAKKKGKAGAQNGVSAKQKEEEEKKKAEEEAKQKEEEERVRVVFIHALATAYATLCRLHAQRQRRPRLLLPTPQRRQDDRLVRQHNRFISLPTICTILSMCRSFLRTFTLLLHCP